MPKKSICIIDPLKNILDVLRMILDEKGYEVDTALGLEQALHHCSRKRYAIIISEYFSPPEKMLRFIRSLKDLIPEVYCIISTSVIINDSVYKKLFDTGLDDLLIKPYGREKLLAHIEKGLKRQGLTGKNEKNGLRRLTDPYEDSSGIVTPVYFKRFIRRELKKARRHQQSFSIILMELPSKDLLGEGFESFYAELTCLLRNSLREEDFLGRENGNLGILLQQTDQEGSQVLGKRLSNLIQTLPAFRNNLALCPLFNDGAFQYYTFPKETEVPGFIKPLLDEIDQELHL